MVTLTAGIPTVTTSLPNPDFGNTEGLNVEVDYREAINGKPWVYRTTTTDRNIVMTWTSLGRGKLVELAEFFKAFIGEEITVVDHKGDTWRTVFEDTSLSITTSKLGKDVPGGRQESGEITLSFVGTQLNA